MFLQVILSPDTRILLNADLEIRRHNETIDIHYSDSNGTNNKNFSFVTRMSIPIPSIPRVPLLGLQTPIFAFSADGSKFAMAMTHGRVFIWDIQSKVPFKTFMEVPKWEYYTRPVRYLQFSTGNLGKEALVFVEVCLMFTLWHPHLSNRWSESLARSFLQS